ncbi:MAG: hypothetical protein ACI9EF_001444 [Pseudohongiellaceae bacterium]|jgi:hypothetical protein
MSPLHFTLSLAAVLGVCPSLAWAAPSDLEGDVVLRVGDNVPGLGDVTVIREVAIDDLGNWYVDVNTDFPNNDQDDAVVRSGALLYQEGHSLNLPVGTVVDAFDDLDGSIVDNDLPGWVLFMDGGGLGNPENQGVFVGDELILQGGDQTNVPGMPAGTIWSSLLDVKANEADQLLVMSTVMDPNQGFIRALVKLQLDGLGGILSRELISYPGMVPAGQADQVEELEFGVHEFALSDGGHVIHSARLSGSPSLDVAILVDGGIVAREGGVSPVAGRPWQVLNNAEVDVNTHGDWALTGILTGVNDDDTLIERSGEVLVREADVLPGISPFAVTALSITATPGPIHIGDNGNVLWMGTWSDPDTTKNRGLFLNDRLLVQQNVTSINGELLTLLEGTEGSYGLSDDGETVVLRARLAGNVPAVVVIDVGPWTSLGQGLAGSGGLMPSLVGSGPMTGNSQLGLCLTNGLPSAASWLVAGFSNLSQPLKGGILVPNADLVVPLALDPQGELELSLALPPIVPQGLPIYAQFFVQDPAGPVGFSVSNAVLGIAP